MHVTHWIDIVNYFKTHVIVINQKKKQCKQINIVSIHEIGNSSQETRMK